LLTWKDPSGVPEGAMIQIRRAVPPAYDWTDIATVKLGVERYEDTTAKDGVVYRYEIAVTVPAAGVSGPPVVSDPLPRTTTGSARTARIPSSPRSSSSSSS